MTKSITLPIPKFKVAYDELTIEIDPQELAKILASDSEYVHELLFCLCEEMGNERIKDYINE